MAGLAVRGRFDPNNPTGAPSIGPSELPYGSPSAFSAAAETQATDYDRIMGAYEDLLKSTRNPTARLAYSPLAPQTSEYQRGTYRESPELNSAIGEYSGISKSGGYTPQGISDIRSRAISPIRSIYANAQRGLDRQRTLQGGYSPNYTAGSAKMARELSGQIGDISTNVEASIAENVARNKMSAISGLTPLLASQANARNAFESAENVRMNESTVRNTEAVNRANEQNRMLPLQYEQFNAGQDAIQFNQQMAPIQGMTSIYGTTPALTQTFGGQVLNATQLAQQAQQQKTAQQLALEQMGLRFAGGFAG